MKRITAGIALSLGFLMSASAFADVSSIALRFGGGCVSSNTTGGCVLKSTFSGFDLETETAVLYTCSTPQGNCKKLSPRLHPITVDGEVLMRVRNIPGECFQVRTGPNGNDKPDAHSRIVCEK